jgi:hypothetical protein
MSESPNSSKRRWWQFGLRGILVLTLVVAAFFAGYARRIAEVQELQQAIENERIKCSDLEAERNEIARRSWEWEHKYYGASNDYHDLQRSLDKDSPPSDQSP